MPPLKRWNAALQIWEYLSGGGGSGNVTKESVEAVLTGEITTHTHARNLDMGNPWSIAQYDPAVDEVFDCGSPSDL